MKKAYDYNGEYLGRFVLDGDCIRYSPFHETILLDITDSEVMSFGWKFNDWVKHQNILDASDVDTIRSVVDDDTYYYWIPKDDVEKYIEVKEPNLMVMETE